MKRLGYKKRISILILVIFTIQLGLMSPVSAVYYGEPTYIANIGGVDYKIQEFKSSGTFIVPAGVTSVDVTVVGGGGGAYRASASDSSGGGGGGYVTNQYNVPLTPGSTVIVTIGAGCSSVYASTGGQSSFGAIIANGGKSNDGHSRGADGGSGGGGGAIYVEDTGKTYPGSIGGANGSDGQYLNRASAPGIGQGTTTYGVNGVLYGGGGGGGGYVGTPGGIGGSGGGGNGGMNALGTPGIDNTGGGAGGSGEYCGTNYVNGGSGIVVVRWVANQSPTISTTSPVTNGIYSNYDTSLIPQISVFDRNNDTLTCNYYIDSETMARETKTVSNTPTAQNVLFSAFDMGTLTEGSHTMKFEVSDGIASPVTQTVNFQVDKSNPMLETCIYTSTVSSITITGSATDSTSGLYNNTATNEGPYRYTLSGFSSTSWLITTSHTQEGLSLNTRYTATLEARDTVGHIASESKDIYTKAEVPSAVTDNPSSYSIDINVTDNNPSYTEYQISVNNGERYVTPEGALTSSPVWVTMPSKNITVQGLVSETSYNFQVKARNGDVVETEWSSSISGITLMPPPGSPTNIISAATDSTITVSWAALADATSYEVEADGTVVSADASITYTHTGLNPGTPHTYRIRGINEGGPGNWSLPISKSTLPSAPNIPANLSAIPLSTSITVTWDNVPGATGYNIEVDGALVNNGPNTNYRHTSLTPGTSHTYRVSSINAGGKSAWSSPIAVTTLVESTPVPINVSAVPSKNQIAVTWDAVDGATGYDIEVDGVSFGNNTKTSYTHSNLEPGTDHMYRVRAKRGSTVSDWSAMVIATTLTDAFGVPSNFTAYAEDTYVSLSWDTVTDAVYYDVEIDGEVIDLGTRTSCIHDGLEPDTTHSYRVRASSDTETSDWSEMLTVTTFTLPTTKNITTTASETSIQTVWEEVYGATSYDIEFDGTIISDILGTTYTCEGLGSGTQHALSIRAKNQSGTSNWSIPAIQSTKRNGSDVPYISGIVEKDLAVIMWNSMDGATGYDLEVDGTVIENIVGTSYRHIGLTPGTSHTYRVRVRDNSGTGNWSNTFTTLTMSETPAVPANIAASSNMTSILVTWDKVANAEGYEIEVDGVVVDNGTGTSYLHNGLSPDTTHSYRVRANNIGGYSEWSELVSKSTVSSLQTYTIDCITGDEFNLLLSAANIQDLGNYSFTVRYNVEDFDVTDLCGLTPRIDTSTGSITGTDIKITQYEPGTIVFIKTSSAQTYEVWSGIVNSIKFKAEHDGQLVITYSIN